MFFILEWLIELSEHLTKVIFVIEKKKEIVSYFCYIQIKIQLLFLLFFRTFNFKIYWDSI